MKYWEIEIDGTDKTGKDLLLQYICVLGKYKYSINPRGLMSQLVYTKKFNRDYVYDLEVLNKNKVYVMLYAEPDDLEVRCRVTHEPKYDYIEDTKLYHEVYSELESKGFKLLKFNTSEVTPYNIAKSVIEYIESLEEQDNA